MPNPYLLFCPYLPLGPRDKPVEFADWELGPLQSFQNRWMDPRFKSQAETFLQKFVGPHDDKPIRAPALLCRKGQKLDGKGPSDEELRALELSIAFAFLDNNPRHDPENPQDGSAVVTSDNTELYLWPIDLERGHVTVTSGLLVSVKTAGYTIDSRKLLLRPPLDLHMPFLARSPDSLLMTGIYKTVVESLHSPGSSPTADRIRVAVEWLAKAWRNTATVLYPERIVFLKTAFEAITGTSSTPKSARKLREIFEAVPGTKKKHSEILVWSPEEKGIPRKWTDKRGRSKIHVMTDLEAWFMEFGRARNMIIHEGQTPQLTYTADNPAYRGHFFYTAEFLLRGTIKVLLSEIGYENAWRSHRWRYISRYVREHFYR